MMPLNSDPQNEFKLFEVSFNRSCGHLFDDHLFFTHCDVLKRKSHLINHACLLLQFLGTCTRYCLAVSPHSRYHVRLNRLVVDRLRQGSIFSYIVVEIVWLSILWVLWLITGSYAAWTDGQLIAALPSESSCDFGLFADSNDAQICHEIKAIMAFSFHAWILLMSYTVMLMVLAIRAKGRGNSAWTTGVRDGVLFCSIRKTMEGAAQVQAAQATMPYPLPPPQQPYPPYPSSYPIPQV